MGRRRKFVEEGTISVNQSVTQCGVDPISFLFFSFFLSLLTFRTDSLSPSSNWLPTRNCALRNWCFQEASGCQTSEKNHNEKRQSIVFRPCFPDSWETWFAQLFFVLLIRSNLKFQESSLKFQESSFKKKKKVWSLKSSKKQY